MTEKACSNCGGILGKRYYQDVPDIGDLCLNCHAEWTKENKVSEKKFTKQICIDFDGVLHSYTSGWKGHDVVADPPVAGAIEWLRALIANPDMTPMVYSSRSKEEEGVFAMKNWLLHYGLTVEELAQIEFPMTKPAAWLTVDDRCFHFRGQFPSIDYIETFKPWNK